VALADGEGGVALAGREAFAPLKAACGVRDAEIGRLILGAHC